jgi:hypothetical protein
MSLGIRGSDEVKPYTTVFPQVSGRAALRWARTLTKAFGVSYVKSG